LISGSRIRSPGTAGIAGFPIIRTLPLPLILSVRLIGSLLVVAVRSSAPARVN
jgi:hypothetical protein